MGGEVSLLLLICLWLGAFCPSSIPAVQLERLFSGPSGLRILPSNTPSAWARHKVEGNSKIEATTGGCGGSDRPRSDRGCHWSGRWSGIVKIFCTYLYCRISADLSPVSSLADSILLGIHPRAGCPSMLCGHCIGHFPALVVLFLF